MTSPQERAPMWPGCEALLDRASTTGQNPDGTELERLRSFGERRALLATKNGRMVCIAPGDQQQALTYFAQQAHAADLLFHPVLARDRRAMAYRERAPHIGVR
ncbi:hypothetical protein [Streptomyces stephensoniae]|uniref:hypothetical protein n=1 Tax=Streptomyces stephensoniae TaxID=3375367 RepID=UPI0037DA6D30